MVRPHDTALRFLVSSKSRPDEDQLADVGADECSCEHWQFRLKEKPPGIARRCSHLMAAREFLLTEVIERIKSTRTESE